MPNLEDATQDEYRAAAQDTRGTDEKGRPMVETMTDREILKELLETMRALADVLQAVGESPMAAAMMPGLARLGK